MRTLFLFFSVALWSQSIPKIDFISLKAELTPSFKTRSISGTCRYIVQVNQKIDSIKIDAIKMKFEQVKINGKSVNYKNTNKSLVLFEGYKIGKNEITFNYQATPKQTMYFVDMGNDSLFLSSNNKEHIHNKYQIWTQGQGKYTSHWLPSFDDVNEKLVFHLSIFAEPFYKVISNGVLKKIIQPGIKANKKWVYEMKKPMSSYLAMLTIGAFDSKEIVSKGGKKLQLYYKYEDANKFDYTYKYSKEIFNFLEKEIDLDYPWKIYKQVPVEDFLYAGMENTTATLFSQDFVVDKTGFNDKNYINVNAHELAHHWFGDLVTAKEGKHHWLQEGFATYYALLAEKHLFGDTHFQFELLKYAEEINANSKKDTIPILNEKASLLSFYKKGAWALHYLKESIGDHCFKKAVKAYLKEYQYKNVETDNFLNEIQKVAPHFDIAQFKKEWLESPGFDIEKVVQILSQNKEVKKYFELQEMQTIPFDQKKVFFENILLSNQYVALVQEIIYQLGNISYHEKAELLKLAMNTKNIAIRQAIAETIQTIPLEFRSDYEQLLDDESYITKEIALVQLCKQFPENCAIYLNKTKEIIGLNDKSFRITWLGLAIKSKIERKEVYEPFLSELLEYTTLKFSSTIRQNALEVILKINPTHPIVLKSLVNATQHHKWQFVRFSKNTIRAMLKKEYFKKAFEGILPNLSGKEELFLCNELK
ncbi:M1 family metallopeptidase [Flavobacterium columnare]|uniref:M1 family metallopeptidase n=1 Tax=Flavobacterium columnare TaxID=996 RepID=UPI002D205FB1|nr:M1 family metallopeptidase [Flavobacterium columnare]MEB3800425.1 M1 family metallopeptidase [Flavobacterium columnare]